MRRPLSKWSPRRDERAVSAVPTWCLATLVCAAMLQATYVWSRPAPVASARALPPALSVHAMRLFSLGEEVTGAKLFTLWLQAFDNQPGLSVPFARLDYARISDWLRRIVQLDPRANYPLLAAARVYAMVPDPARQRLMLDFVFEQFLLAPNERWQWVAHAAVVAKHRLHDPKLALKYAQGLREHVSIEIPFWARDLAVVILHDMGELEAAKVIIGGLLEAGEITDPNEIRFLESRLKLIESEQRGQ
ncbi:MAG: hypothetical protein K0U93_02470 [Gammaproteobacteria bacterium]|nr:hypothetical protein [Gammaproteobacteria bacterium]